MAKRASNSGWLQSLLTSIYKLNFHASLCFGISITHNE